MLRRLHELLDTKKSLRYTEGCDPPEHEPGLTFNIPEGIGESKVRVGEVQPLVRPGGKPAILLGSV